MNTQILSIICSCAYVAIILFIAQHLGRRGGRNSLEGFTLAGKSLPWYIIAASVMATITNPATLLGGAGGIYVMGISQQFWTVLLSVTCGILLIPLVGERLRNVNCTSLTDLSEKRFPGSKRMTFILTVWSIAWGCFASAICIYGGGVLLQTLLGIPLITAVIIVAVVSVLYTLIGGLSVLAIVDTLQYVIIGVIVAVITPLLFVKYDSFSALVGTLAGPTGYEVTAAGEALNITPGFFDIFHLPGWGVMGFLAFMLACSLWVPVDLGVIQRFLAEKKSGEGVKGMRAYALIFVPTILIMYSLGMWGKAIFPNVGYIDSVSLLVAESAMGSLGTVLFMLAITAALLSTVAAYFNAVATALTQTVYMKLRPGRADKHYLGAARAFTVVAAVVSLVIAPVIGIDGITITAVMVQMLMCSTLAPTVLVMCYWKRFSERAAFYGIAIALAVGIISTLKAGGAYAAIYGGGLFGIPTLFLGLLVIIPIFIIVSLMTPYDSMKTGLEFQQLFTEKVLSNYEGKKDLIVGGIVVAVLILFAILGFSNKIPPFPAFTGASALVIDGGLLLFSAIALFGAIFLGYKLIRFMAAKEN